MVREVAFNLGIKGRGRTSLWKRRREVRRRNRNRYCKVTWQHMQRPRGETEMNLFKEGSFWQGIKTGTHDMR